MEKTLLVGDQLIMSRIGYDAAFRSPTPTFRSGAIQAPADHHLQAAVDRNQPDYVKAPSWLAGDVVDVRDNSVWINGKRLDEPYTIGPSRPLLLRITKRIQRQGKRPAL